MRAFRAVLITFLQSGLILASPRAPATLSNVEKSGHITDLMVRNASLAPAPLDEHDRGTWTLDCTKAAAACNNACWSINCLGQDTKKMYYDPASDNKENRKQSGCDAGGSVCKMMPFSQMFKDPKLLDETTCAGSQLRSFLDPNVNRPNRRGNQPFVDSDFWMVEFEHTEGAPYCNAKKDEDSCKNDGDQFEASRTGGKVSYPYNYETDNRYRRNGDVAFSLVDVAQCSVHLRRKSVPKKDFKKRSAIMGPGPPVIEREIRFEAEVFDHFWNSKGKESGVPTEDEPITLSGLTTNLKIWSVGNSLEDDAQYLIEGVELDWFSSYEGIAGPYCTVGGVDGEHGTKDEDCWFPCFVKE
ncbi:MAG: hypothetical protein Q9183_003079 [Haloplaca sp. 2 TL-2023]